jgi:hypothetical protein
LCSLCDLADIPGPGEDSKFDKKCPGFKHFSKRCCETFKILYIHIIQVSYIYNYRASRGVEGEIQTKG